MKFTFKYVILMLTLVLCVNLSYAAECCYVPGSEITGILFKDVCDSGEVSVGEPDYDNAPDFCQEYEDLRVGCKQTTTGSSCNKFFEGNRIYDIPVVLSAIGLSEADDCPGGFETNLDLCSETSGTGGGDVIDGDDGDLPPGGSGNPLVDDDTVNLTSDNVAEREFCSNAGDPFGFFVTKSSCEAIDGGTCIYNPYLGGLFSTKFENSDVLSLSYFESACIPKLDIETCYDYKTEFNCEGNVASDVSMSGELEGGCKWIDSSSYSDGLFSGRNGICIPISIDENKFFNEFYYSFRMNLIENPGFEDADVGVWNGADVGSRVDMVNGELRYPFEGRFAYVLGAGSQISQDIYFVATGIAYSPSIYIMSENFVAGDSLELTVSAYDKDGSELLTSLNVFGLNDTFGSAAQGSSFLKVVGSSFVIPENTEKVVYTLFSDVSGSGTIYADSISFEPFNTEAVNAFDSIYKPVQVLDSRASICETCYDPLNLNYCTQSKSDYLGDCSYMTESLDEPYSMELDEELDEDLYFGRENNIFMDDENMWGSQSLANSLLFCELYLTEVQCEDETNYVNSKFTKLHLTDSLASDSTLCKWQEGVGCFKDSDGNGYPDVRQGYPFLRLYDEDDMGVFESFDSYDAVGDHANGELSDFELSCDILPPNGYIVFSGMNSDGELATYTGSAGELIGALDIEIYASDAELDSCSNFSIEPTIYVDYEVNGVAYDRFYEANQFSFVMPVKDFFTNPDEDGSLIEDGTNEISVIFKDQSGNVQRDMVYSLDIDVSGPSIELVEPDPSNLVGDEGEIPVLDTVLSTGSTFEFHITDMGGVDFCNYTMTDYTGEAESSYYNASGSFDFDGETEIDHVMDVPVYNSSVSQDVYLFDFSCTDIFGQMSNFPFVILVDFRTDLVVLEPIDFASYDLDIGFYNDTVSFWGVSSEQTLDSCSLSFDDGTTADLIITEYEDGFEVSQLPGVILYNNITGSIEFTSSGLKTGTANCIDSNGNSISEDIEIYFDDVDPVIEDYELVGVESGDVTTVVEIGGSYYTYSNDAGYFNVTMDGTETWIKDDLSWNYNDPVDGLVELGSGVSFDLSTVNTSFIANLKIDNFDNSLGTLYAGDNSTTGHEDLFYVEHVLKFADKAGNYVEQEMAYYYDDSTPNLDFGGDIVSEVDGNLYSAEKDPTIELDFNVPLYRTYICDVTAYVSGIGTFGPLVVDTSSDSSFSLKEIGGSLDLETYSGLTLSFDCIDVYGLSYLESFGLYYDVTPPELNEIYLDGGDNKYFRNLDGLVYDDLVDALVFDLNDTNEVGYVCEYQFVTNPHYNCDESWFNESFSGSGGYKTTDDFVMILGSESDNEDAICSRTSQFDVDLDAAFDADSDLETNLFVRARCEDLVGLQTAERTIDVSIDYIVSELASFVFETTEEGMIPVVTAVQDFDSGVYISLNEDGTSPEQILTSSSVEDGLYVYGGSPMDLSEIEHGTHTFWAVVYDASGDVLDKMSAELFVDKIAPEVTLNIPDELEGEIYLTDFQILMDAVDSSGEMWKMELYVDGSLIYNTENLSDYDASRLLKPAAPSNSCGGSSCSGDVSFVNGTVGDVLTFTLKGYDTFGNMNETSVTVEIMDGVAIRLIDTVPDSFADPSKFAWVTSMTAPRIAFETTKVVSSCTISPMVDQEWVIITGDSGVFSRSETQSGGSSFEFDLSSFEDFDLSELSDGENAINIKCLFEGEYYTFERTLKYIDYLPDYVLTTDRGFVIADEPYEVLATVRSVGAYPYITCKYKVGLQGTFIDITPAEATDMSFTIDFTGSVGTIPLTLLCEDLVGNEGPEIVYDFVVSSGGALEVEEIELSLGDDVFGVEGDDKIYIGGDGLYDLTFRVNKENAECSYVIENQDGIFSGIVNFFKRLFSVGRVDMSSTDDAFEFTASGLEFGDINTLSVGCDHEDGSSVEVGVSVLRDTEIYTINASREALN